MVDVYYNFVHDVVRKVQNVVFYHELARQKGFMDDTLKKKIESSELVVNLFLKGLVKSKDLQGKLKTKLRTLYALGRSFDWVNDFNRLQSYAGYLKSGRTF